MERPYTVVFSTTTLDGRIASSTGYSMLSCPYDLARLRLLRGMVEAVMVGANTVVVDNPRLVSRLEPRTSKYYRVIVDGKLRVPLEARVFQDPDPPVVVFTATASEKASRLRERGVAVHVVGRRGVVELAKALEILVEEYGVRRLLVEGGGILVYNLLSGRLVDEIRATITGYVFGAGRSIVEDPAGKGFTETSQSPRLRLECVEKCPCNNCVHIAYRVLDAQCCPVEKEGPEKCLSGKLPVVVDKTSA